MWIENQAFEDSAPDTCIRQSVSPPFTFRLPSPVFRPSPDQALYDPTWEHRVVDVASNYCPNSFHGYSTAVDNVLSRGCLSALSTTYTHFCTPYKSRPRSSIAVE
ncbi:hypothetical protein J3458_003669 [Metarhizium acridum]|uniref:uncharacterized protein n=1 Tax=Metarhizium acridum TaxID=92637 RepID=UPI001C6D1F94|nr:hypothetical protein J3458_003669 [Metarhizium acridum]